MQQDKSVVFRGLMKIRLIIFHVGWRLLPIKNGSSGEGERTGWGGGGQGNGGWKRNVVGKEKCPKWREQIRQQENGKGNINSIYNPCDITVTLEFLSACYWEVILFIHTDPIGSWLGIMGNIGYYKDLERYYRASGELAVLSHKSYCMYNEPQPRWIKRVKPSSVLLLYRSGLVQLENWGTNNCRSL